MQKRVENFAKGYLQIRQNVVNYGKTKNRCIINARGGFEKFCGDGVYERANRGKKWKESALLI